MVPFIESGITSHSWKSHFAQLIWTGCCYKQAENQEAHLAVRHHRKGSLSERKRQMKRHLARILKATLHRNHLLSNVLVVWQVVVLQHAVAPTPNYKVWQGWSMRHQLQSGSQNDHWPHSVLVCAHTGQDVPSRSCRDWTPSAPVKCTLPGVVYWSLS